MIKTTKETFQRDQENLIVTKRQDNGYNVTNLRTFKMYAVTKTGSAIHCTCPDHIYRNRICKHMRAVREAWTAQQEARAIQKANQERTRMIIETVKKNGGDAGHWEKKIAA